MGTWLDERVVLAAVLGRPTAPFHEREVLAAIRGLAAAWRLPCRADRWGNLAVEYRRGGKRPHVVFVAHTDHPGFEVESVEGREATLRVLGGVGGPPYGTNARIRFFGSGHGTATPLPATAEGDGWRVTRLRARLAAGARVAPGTPGQWDLPALETNGPWIASRAIDDLAGVAAMLAAVRALQKGGVSARVTALCTRAEEVGFAGAAAAGLDRSVPRDSTVISLEMSRRLPHAPQGNGVVIRLGDRISVFGSAAYRGLWRAGEAIQRREKSFRFQKAFLDGGACEGSLFHALGYATGALACPLGNYHNRSDRDRTIAAERIRKDDWRGMVRILVEFAKAVRPARLEAAEIMERVTASFRKNRKRLLLPVD